MEEDVGTVEEGSLSSDLRLSDPELNVTLIRPDTPHKTISQQRSTHLSLCVDRRG